MLLWRNSILGKDNYIKCGLDADGKDNQLMHASGVDRAVYEAYTKYASMAEKVSLLSDLCQKMTLRLLHRIMAIS